MQQIKDIEKYSDTKPISTFHTTISMPEVNSSEILSTNTLFSVHNLAREKQNYAKPFYKLRSMMAFVFDCLLSKCRQTQEALFSSFAFSHFTPFTFLLPFPSFAGHLIDFMSVPLKSKSCAF